MNNEPVTPTAAIILKQLTAVIDPELGLNIVDLGLIYDVKITQDNNLVEVFMTLTTPGCPMAGMLPTMAEEQLKSAFPEKGIEVHVVWEPSWTPELITENGRMFLGME